MSESSTRISIGTTIGVAFRQIVGAFARAEPSATDYVYPARINWANVLADLHDAGITGYRVAAMMGIGWGTVDGWAREGKEPRHSSGQALLALHTMYCGAEATQKRQSEAKVSL